MPGIVEGEIAAERGAGFLDAVVGAQIDRLILDGPPQPLDEDIGACGPAETD